MVLEVAAVRKPAVVLEVAAVREPAVVVEVAAEETERFPLRFLPCLIAVPSYAKR